MARAAGVDPDCGLTRTQSGGGANDARDDRACVAEDGAEEDSFGVRVLP